MINEDLEKEWSLPLLFVLLRLFIMEKEIKKKKGIYIGNYVKEVVSLYTAIREDGSILNLFTIKDKQLLHSIRHSSFICPECNGKLILKMGQKKITHFAHEKKAYCSRNGEAESYYHLKGKLDLYRKLEELGINPVLEPYFSEIKQRADIGFYFQNKQYVIEFQCAIISPTLIKKRTEGYKKLNISPIWILGFHNLKKWSPLKLKLSTFQYSFLQKYHHYNVLPTYCPNKELFYFHFNPIPISISQSFIYSFLLPLKNIKTFPIKNTFFRMNQWKLEYWKENISHQKTHHVHYPTKDNDRFLKELYRKEMHPHFLPPFIGIPVKSGYLFETPPLFWQSYLMIDTFYSEKQQIKIYALQRIFEQFSSRISRGDIKVRTLPLISSVDWKKGVEEYLTFLVQLGVLEEVKTKFFRLKSMPIPVNNYCFQEKIVNDFYETLRKYQWNLIKDK